MTPSVSEPPRPGTGGTSCRWSRRIAADLRLRDRGVVLRRSRSSEGGLDPRPSFSKRIVVEVTDELPAECPHVIDVFPDSLRCKIRRGEGFEKRTEHCQESFARRQSFFQAHPGAGPAVQIPAVIFKVVMMRRGGGAVYFRSSRSYHFPLHAAAHHNSKSMPSFPRICLPAGPLQFRR